MGKIIVSQLDLNTEQAFAGAVILCALSLLAAWATYAFFKNGFKEGFDRDDVAVGFLAIGFTLMLLGLTHSIIDQSQTKENEYNIVKQATRKVPYYNLKKDGVLIIAEKKSDAPDWLVDKVETKIISENETSYQVQFNEQYARINKKDLK